MTSTGGSVFVSSSSGFHPAAFCGSPPPDSIAPALMGNLSATAPLEPDTDGDGYNDSADFDPLDKNVWKEPGSGSDEMKWLELIIIGAIIILSLLIIILVFVKHSRKRIKMKEEKKPSKPDEIEEVSEREEKEVTDETEKTSDKSKDTNTKDQEDPDKSEGGD